MNPDVPKTKCCGGETWFVVSDVSHRKIVAERHFCEQHGGTFLETYWPRPPFPTIGDNAAGAHTFEVESTLYENGAPNVGCWIVLRGAESTRRLALRTGWSEVWAANVELSGVEYPRPLPHRLTLNTIRALGASLSAVRIDQFVADQHVFHAKLAVLQGQETVLVDTRPSDAIAIALAGGVDILIDTGVLKKL